MRLPLRGRWLLLQAAIFTIIAAVQIAITPAAIDIGVTGEVYSFLVSQGADELVLHEPFSGNQEIDLFKSRGGIFLEMESENARFSQETLDSIQFSVGAKIEYGRILYGRPPLGTARSVPQASCKMKLSIAGAGDSKSVSRLYFHQDVKRGPGRYLILRSKGSDLRVTLQHSARCQYWLRAVASDKSEISWSKDISTPFKNEIIVREGAEVTFRFLQDIAESPGWGVTLFPHPLKHLRQIEIEAIGGRSLSRAPRMRARSYGPEKASLVSHCEVKSDAIQVELKGPTVIEGSRLGDSGSRLIYMTSHPVLTASVLMVNIVILMIFRVAWNIARRPKEKELLHHHSNKDSEEGSRRMSLPPGERQVFISYSHKDTKWKDLLVTHLGVLARQGELDIWSDERIHPGADWHAEIEKALNEAKVVVLMVTANLLTSKFVLDNEIPQMLKRRQQEGLEIFPVIVKPCAWEKVKWLSRLQVLPQGGRPLSKGEESQIDEDLTVIVEKIGKLFDE